VFYNTGHGHLGWTLSALTAQMVADQMTGWAEESKTLSVRAPSPVMNEATAVV
jgi:D-amino-acid dehydrogenase